MGRAASAVAPAWVAVVRGLAWIALAIGLAIGLAAHPAWAGPPPAPAPAGGPSRPGPRPVTPAGGASGAAALPIPGGVGILADALADRVLGELAATGASDRVDLGVSVRAREARVETLARALEAALVARVARRRAATPPAAGAPRSIATLGARASADLAARAGCEVWLAVELGVEAPRLVAAGRLVAADARFWAGVPGPVPASAASPAVDRELAAVALDAELRALAGEPAGAAGAAATGGDGGAGGGARPRGLRAAHLPLELPGAPLALAAGDVDGDGVAELVALTEHHVVVLVVGAARVTERARHALAGPPPVPRPRTPVGAVAVADVDGDGAPEILARSSEHAAGVRLAWEGDALTARGAQALFPICSFRLPAGAAHVCEAALGPATHEFGRGSFAIEPRLGPSAFTLPERFVGASAAALPGDAEDEPARVVLGVVDGGGTLRLYRGGARSAWVHLTGVGAAFAIADLDGDGGLEVATSAWRAPGEGDEVVVRTLRGRDGAARAIFRSEPLRGGVAAMASGDLDGDGLADLAFLARTPGAARGELWVVY